MERSPATHECLVREYLQFWGMLKDKRTVDVQSLTAPRVAEYAASYYNESASGELVADGVLGAFCLTFRTARSG